MTQDEIIEMARKAGLDPDLWNYTDAFEAFAKLVADKEREACAKKAEAQNCHMVAAAIRARGDKHD